MRRLLTVAFAVVLAVGCGGQEERRDAGRSTPPAADRAPAPAASPAVRVGAEELGSDAGRRLRGLRVGLIANAASVTNDGRPSVRALRAHGVRVVRLFAPEHGFRGRGAAGALQGDSRAFGVPVVSLYGEHKAPTAHDLRGLDALVYDLQDVGVRFYTYVSTEILALRAAARAGVPFVVLDRPNPLGGELVAGPVRRGPPTFVATAPGPLVYGLTSGEMARYVNAHSRPRARLTVIRMRGWRRDMTWPADRPPVDAALTRPADAGRRADVPGPGALRGDERLRRRRHAPLVPDALRPVAGPPRPRRARVEARHPGHADHRRPPPGAERREPKFRGRRCRGALLHPRERRAGRRLQGRPRAAAQLRRSPRFRWLQGGAMTDAVSARRRCAAGWTPAGRSSGSSPPRRPRSARGGPSARGSCCTDGHGLPLPPAAAAQQLPDRHDRRRGRGHGSPCGLLAGAARPRRGDRVRPRARPKDPWGLGLISTDDEQEARAIGESDPAVSSGTCTFEVHPVHLAQRG